MKILCVNCVISEFGGVEFAALNLAKKLAARGHEVHFLGAEGAEPQLRPNESGSEPDAQPGDLIQRHYRKFPRIYPLGAQRGSVRKLIWHLQDLAHPANERLFAEVLTETTPDVILLHNITAIGLNIWRPIARAGIPCVQIVHDLSPVCMNMSQFRDGKACHGLCLPCAVQKSVRFSMIDGKANFSFVSPSRATLDIVGRYVDLSQWQQAVIPNANTFLVTPRKVIDGATPTLLYVGRLDPSKGVDILLRAAEKVAESERFVLHVLGTGSQEREFRERYSDSGWVEFHGSVSQERVADFMARALVLMVPSLWPETVPGVAVHALYAALPVVGSRIGGIPEHVFDGLTGMLVEPGNVSAWKDAMIYVLRNPDTVSRWSVESVQKIISIRCG